MELSADCKVVRPLTYRRSARPDTADISGSHAMSLVMLPDRSAPRRQAPEGHAPDLSASCFAGAAAALLRHSDLAVGGAKLRMLSWRRQDDRRGSRGAEGGCSGACRPSGGG